MTQPPPEPPDTVIPFRRLQAAVENAAAEAARLRDQLNGALNTDVRTAARLAFPPAAGSLDALAGCTMIIARALSGPGSPDPPAALDLRAAVVRSATGCALAPEPEPRPSLLARLFTGRARQAARAAAAAGHLAGQADRVMDAAVTLRNLLADYLARPAGLEDPARAAAATLPRLADVTGYLASCFTRAAAAHAAGTADAGTGGAGEAFGDAARLARRSAANMWFTWLQAGSPDDRSLPRRAGAQPAPSRPPDADAAPPPGRSFAPRACDPATPLPFPARQPGRSPAQSLPSRQRGASGHLPASPPSPGRPRR